MIITRILTVDRPAKVVFEYLSDFATTTHWDPATIRTVRTSGDGGVGTSYENTSRFLGRTTTLIYVVTAMRAPELVSLRGENATVVATDSMILRRLAPNLTELTYQAEFSFKGRWRLLAPLLMPILAPAFRKLGAEAEAGLSRALRALPAS